MQNLINVFKSIYRQTTRRYEIKKFDRYRKSYNSLTFLYKTKIAGKWLRQYPEQAHFDIIPIIHWFENIVPRQADVLEIGGWRGDLAARILALYDHIHLWHNYDLIKHNKYQKCNDKRYKLITLHDYLWHLQLKNDYNALIATHMIEHINWREFTELANWIPESIKTVLFESPLPESGENVNWKGDHSSHVLEKGWEQVISEMKGHRFLVEFRGASTIIFKR
jgi:hypothetical protein